MKFPNLVACVGEDPGRTGEQAQRGVGRTNALPLNAILLYSATMDASSDPATVLVVDDDRGTRLLLGAAGFQVLLADGVHAARRLLRTVSPDVMLLDVMMPGESGVDACAQWRADPFWDGLPIILMTAQPTGPYRVPGLLTGADDWIEKPLDVDDLERTVRRWAATGRATGPVPTSILQTAAV